MKEFVMRGQTASGLTHTMNFSGHKGDYGFKLVEFVLYPAVNIGGTTNELLGTVTAGKTAVTPIAPNFDDEGLIAVAQYRDNSNDIYQNTPSASVINDTFIITQDLILMVQDTAGSSNAVNWQCKFLPVKLSSSEAALTNYRQFSIFDE